MAESVRAQAADSVSQWSRVRIMSGSDLELVRDLSCISASGDMWCTRILGNGQASEKHSHGARAVSLKIRALEKNAKTIRPTLLNLERIDDAAFLPIS